MVITLYTFVLSEPKYNRISITQKDHAPGALGMIFVIKISTFSQCNVLGYLVYSDMCKIPEYDVYDPRVMRYIFYSEYHKCSGKQPLTTVTFNSSINMYEVALKSEYLTQYTFASEVDCSFRGIVKCDNYNSDDCSDYSQSISIDHGKALIPLDYDHIRAECFQNDNKIYDNVHSTVPEKRDVKKRLRNWHGKGKPISVLFLGIDTMSRMNFIRTMPKTAKYIYGDTNDWYQFNGYNKVTYIELFRDRVALFSDTVKFLSLVLSKLHDVNWCFAVNC